MGWLDTVKYAAIGKQAEEAAKMSQVAEQAKSQGASEYERGLAALAAEQAFMDANQPQVVGRGMEQGGRAFTQGSTAPMTNGTQDWLDGLRARKAGLAGMGVQ